MKQKPPATQPAPPSIQVSPPPTPQVRVAVEALGCRLNHAEAATLRMQLQQQGFCVVPWGEPADVQVVNACTVTAQADAKTRHMLRNAKRRLPQSKVVVMGCGAESQGEYLIQQRIADASIKNGAKTEAASLIQQWLHYTHKHQEYQAQACLQRMTHSAITPGFAAKRHFSLAPDAHGFNPQLLQKSNPRVRASLKIQDGCHFSCAFCTIPRVRGGPRSRILADLLQEARAMADAGVKEMVLTGVNLGLYRYEGKALLAVVDALDGIAGLARIRLSSIEPTTVDEGLLERMANPQHKLVPFLHLPLQSGSQATLRNMRRRYSPQEYIRFVQRAAARIPQLCLGTDVMCGFPGESTAHFEETLSLVRDLPFAYLHVFPFSPRAKTLAMQRKEHVPSQIIKDRASILRQQSAAKQLAFQKQQVGKTVPVLFENAQNQTLIGGYTPNYLRVEVHVANPQTLQNTLARVTLLEAGGHAVAGVLA